ncbi:MULTISPECIES: helix-turn-helix domain-containing protein [Leptospira]|uniref:ParB-like protein n=1 Tax=Leptospira weilii str. UI 13098 TaxID=1088542 RepID=M6QKL4_9LEPT|nr:MULTISPECIES: helix-turn-helix domain-containing protein [Leptospira]EMJ59895.1 ParB-like protein [Leptospira sp. P2653]EMN89432.1 ParB-like protein [Leptospira weilii str. UI 13098]
MQDQIKPRLILTVQSEANPPIAQIPLDRIQFHPKNSELFERKSEAFIRNLSIDIDMFGLQEPISVRYIEENNTYICLSGENRVNAVKLLGWTFISGYIVSPKNEIGYIISRNTKRRHFGHQGRVRIYQVYCPEFFTGNKIKNNRLDIISNDTGIPIATIKSDLKKIRSGSSKEVTLEELRGLWEKKKIRGLRVSISDLSDGNFLLQVNGKNLNYEWKGKFKDVIRDSADAARSKSFNKNFKFENSETASRIRELRKDARMTQFELAQALGYSQSYIAELEGGKWECSTALFEDIAILCEDRMK